MSRHLSILEQRIAWTRFDRPSDKDVLMAMARWFCWRADGTCRSFPVTQLVVRSRMRRRTVERALERLEADWWIEVISRQPGTRQPTLYRIVVNRLATRDPEDVTTARVADVGPPQPPHWRSSDDETSKNRPDFDKVADQSTEEEVRTEVHSAAPAVLHSRHIGGRPEHPDVPAFLTWAVTTYPAHAHGATLVLDRDRDGHLVSGLLEHYPLERLQAMTVLMWTIAADGDPSSHATWIAKSDHHLRVLKHKAAFLERVVVGAQQLTFGALEPVKLTAKEIDEAKEIHRRCGGYCRHDPPHEDWKDCVRAIALKRHVS